MQVDLIIPYTLTRLAIQRAADNTEWAYNVKLTSSMSGAEFQSYNSPGTDSFKVTNTLLTIIYALCIF